MRKSEIIIHPYKPADYQNLIGAINSVCTEGKWMEVNEYQPTQKWEYFFKNSTHSDYLLLLCTRNKDTVGWFRLFPAKNNYWELGIGLVKKYRNQGIGTQLLNEGFNWASRKAISRIQLTVFSNNQRALHLFKKFGFITESSFENKYLMKIHIPQNLK